MPNVRYYPTQPDYVAALETDAKRWVAPKPGTYADLHEARLLPRGL